MMMKYFLVLIVVSSFELGCSRKIQQTDPHDQCKWNVAETFRLCTEKMVDPKSRVENTTYTVYTGENEIRKEGLLIGGFVRWLNDEAIEFFQPPGMMREGQTKDDLVKVFIPASGETLLKKDYLERINSSQK